MIVTGKYLTIYHGGSMRLKTTLPFYLIKFILLLLLAVQSIYVDLEGLLHLFLGDLLDKGIGVALAVLLHAVNDGTSGEKLFIYV